MSTPDPTIVNRALQVLGTRTTVSAAELAAGSSNEAIQAMIIYDVMRDNLSRMAPWDFCSATGNLVYLTSLPGTKENLNYGTFPWSPGLPIPPWAYEYAYPEDCLRALRIAPKADWGFIGTPIYPTQTGFDTHSIRRHERHRPFRVATDKFYPITNVQVLNGGVQHWPGDLLTVATVATSDFDPSSMSADFATNTKPQGASPLIVVDTTNPNTGAILTAHIFSTTETDGNPTDYRGFIGGGYFRPNLSPQPQGTSTGDGTGALFQFAYGPRTDCRVILTDESQAALAYVKRVTDTSMMDALFIEAWVNVLASGLCMALTGDKQMANMRIKIANDMIMTARAADANESMDVYDVEPDWLAARNDLGSRYFCPGIDWGPLWPSV